MHWCSSLLPLSVCVCFWYRFCLWFWFTLSPFFRLIFSVVTHNSCSCFCLLFSLPLPSNNDRYIERNKKEKGISHSQEEIKGWNDHDHDSPVNLFLSIQRSKWNEFNWIQIGIQVSLFDCFLFKHKGIFVLSFGSLTQYFLNSYLTDAYSVGIDF